MSSRLHLRLESLEDDDPWIVDEKTFDLLNEYLQPDSAISASTAARIMDALTPAKREAAGAKNVEHPESFLFETWETFIEIAKQIPHDHPSQDRLIQLLAELTKLSPTEVEIWGVSTK